MSELSYWLNIIKKNPETFFITLYSVFSDYLIVYLISKYGKWEGSSRAYSYGLPWGRAKFLRNYQFPKESEYYLNCAYSVAEMDTKIKMGSLNREKCIDYFISIII